MGGLGRFFQLCPWVLPSIRPWRYNGRPGTEVCVPGFSLVLDPRGIMGGLGRKLRVLVRKR